MTSDVKEFAALDFETLDTWRPSVCAVACVIIDKDGKILDEYYTTVCPPTRFENKYCVEAHGLHYNDVKNSPIFEEVWPKVDKMIGDRPIIAHNSAFERSCINACAEEFGTNDKYRYIDTLKLSRELLTECENHRLNTVCEKLDVDLKHHHNALEDARAAAQCFVKLMELGGFGYAINDNGLLIKKKIIKPPTF